MKTLSTEHRAALAALGSAALSPGYEFRSSSLSLYASRASHRPDLAGRIYLEAFEKIPAGVTFLNWWAPDTRQGREDFFAALAERRGEFVSPRPYALGQACDGTIDASVHAAFKVACDALGFDADALHREAYPEETPPNWAKSQEFADWQGGIAWPATWNDAALDALTESLHEINNHSLAAALDAARSS